uniref:Uncharacterized protein n=1 Tax=Heliothis virescens TaxID=7102 RepID=A0A2A4JTH8_HELVI
MSLRVASFSVERPKVTWCLFCNKPGTLVTEPDAQTYDTIKQIADQRQDVIRDQFYILYDENLAKQCFSWHEGCAAIYTAPEDSKQDQVIPKQEDPHEEIEIKIEDVQFSSVIKAVRSSRVRAAPAEAVVKCLFCDQHLNPEHKKPHSMHSRMSVARLIYDAAHRKQDRVFSKIRMYDSPEAMINRGMYFHKECYVKYVKLPNCCQRKRAGKISREDMIRGLKRLLKEIDDKLPTCCFEVSYLAKRLATLTEVKDAVVDVETVKGLLVAKYGDKLLFSYPNGLDSCVVFLSSVPLNEVMLRVR